MQPCLRLARADDLIHLAEIERACTAILVKAGAELGSNADGILPTAILENCLADRLLMLAVDEGDRPIGFLAAAERDGGLYIGELDVHPDWQRRGTGRALVMWALEEASRRGLWGAMLTTDRYVPFNAPFYAKLGFGVVAGDELPLSLKRVLVEEERSGMNPLRRVAMVCRF
jgi:GNAT superfamily N-acetyltransferase